ncbi:MAG TPA: aminopeptidase [Candidatus Eubacterium avistercoris]|uniref:M18 family aminopeptidase n=1 Tax=Candidatus Eubacterium avistercoris TaxID=2838567 RepID=A0A9D2D4S4_9FIRM|nr:aminopeptidase [Candidatus Eubacterium avistercoris]
MERENAWKKYSLEEEKKVFAFGEEYRKFISKCKTERECVDEIVKLAKAAGFADMEQVIASGRKLKAGDRVYAVNKGKGMALFIIGRENMEQGMHILGAHIDSPRLDLKQNPLYEDTGMAMLDTHYYGGVKKYQWVTLPLAMHGVVAKKDGSTVQINIGEKPEDPVFGVSDLLIHLSGEQMEKKAAKVIEGEAMDVLIASRPLKDADEKTKEKVKANVLDILKAHYGIEEEDFLSAEIEIVPAGAARNYGLDNSMIMGYGHDDRVCAYPSFAAMLDVEIPEKTSVCLLVDKEEIGSVGATGMQSRFFENITAEVMEACGTYSELALRRALENSDALSSDVSAAYDPNYPSVMEKKNAAYFGRGVVFNKYTGARGKSGSNDASAEYMAKIRSIMDENHVNFQTAELGKVDQGGGGTIAYILGNYNMQVIDSGVAVLNMHAPWEIISKADLYEAKCCYEAFLKQ